MRIAIYNQMFGCDGRSLSGFLSTHYLHRAKKYHQLEKKVNLNRTLKTIQKAKADIVGIMEVLGEKQRKLLIRELREQGYKSFYVGYGHGLNQDYGNVETLLATCFDDEQIFQPKFSVPANLGFGGGIVAVYIPSKDLYVIQLHLPLCRGRTKKFFTAQFENLLIEIEKIRVMKLNPKIVVMGDFNCCTKDLLKFFPQFSRFKDLSAGLSTCSVNNFLRWFYCKDLDHIFGLNFKAKAKGMIEDFSDHALVWVEVDLKKPSG